jgi:uncharacterized protein (TIGR02300 family)
MPRLDDFVQPSVMQRDDRMVSVPDEGARAREKMKGSNPMAKAELGEKRRCLSCGAPFFDLKRNPIVCPKCATVFQIVEVVRSSSKYAPARPNPFKKPAPVEPAPADEVLLVDDEEDVEISIAPADGDEGDEVEDDGDEVQVADTTD